MIPAPRAAIKTSDSYRYGIGYNDELPPLSTVREWFQDLTKEAVRLGLLDAAKHLNKRPLRVATMCSGTESPLLALRHISKSKFTVQYSRMLYLIFCPCRLIWPKLL